MEQKFTLKRNDIESICGFQSKKFTGVNMFLAFLGGLLLTAIFYGALLPFHNPDFDIQYIEMFFHGGRENRSCIPYFTVFFFCFAVAILLIKNMKLRGQRRALSVNILPADAVFTLTPHTAREILDNMYAKVENPSQFVLFDRVERALSNLQNLGSVAAVSECLKNQADNDDSFLTSSYTVLKGFIWAIPVLGFIGTVLGLSQAVGGFGITVASGASLDELKSALGGVTSGLSVAFETTLIALVLALILQMYMTFTLNKEEQFLDQCADYCHKNIISKMKNIPSSDEQNA